MSLDVRPWCLHPVPLRRTVPEDLPFELGAALLASIYFTQYPARKMVVWFITPRMAIPHLQQTAEVDFATSSAHLEAILAPNIRVLAPS